MWGKKLELSPAITADKRGTHTNRPHKIHSEVLACIKKHIDMIPVVDSHYTRQNTTKQYLESDLSIANMNHFYLKWALSETTNAMAQNVTLR